MIRFLGRYLLRYLPWILVAGLAAASFALLTGVLVVLIEPVFGEVLLADSSTISESGSGGRAVESMIGDQEAGGEENRLKESVEGFFTGGYEYLKEAFGITPDTVVYFLPVLLVLIFLARAALSFVSGYSFQHVGLGVTTDIRNDLYRSVLEQSSRFLSEHPSGEIISRIVNDVTTIQTAVSQRVVDLVQMSMTLVVLVILLFVNNARLALISLVLLPLVLVPIVRFGQGMRRTSHRSQERMADLAGLVAEGVRGHRVVKAFGMEEFEHTRFRQATKRHLRVNLWATLLNNLSSPVIETVAVAGLAALLIYAGLEIRNGAMKAPAFLEFLFNLVFMYEPIRKLNKVNLVLQQSLAAVHRVRDLMVLPNEIEEAVDAITVEDMKREISFVDVSFAYEDNPVLRSLDLTIHRGETVALVGPSGAGKSTIVNLLPRFFDPDSGRVEIDGTDIRRLSLASLRSLIGIVTQETILFNDSVRGNIAYGHGDISLARIRSAARAAYAEEFILDLPEGYDTVIGEGGMNLSGGQRQRLAIARALLKDAPILILDEATSQLDTESEALVQKALENLMSGRTTLVIAHRLSTVKRADRIIVLEGGSIVEEGGHEELLAQSGKYRQLYDLQFQT
jgi:subfamily B ATP-binding cassette protein MsbA